jgi:hypothetical protein
MSIAITPTCGGRLGQWATTGSGSIFRYLTLPTLEEGRIGVIVSSPRVA